MELFYGISMKRIELNGLVERWMKSLPRLQSTNRWPRQYSTSINNNQMTQRFTQWFTTTSFSRSSFIVDSIVAKTNFHNNCLSELYIPFLVASLSRFHALFLVRLLSRCYRRVVVFPVREWPFSAWWTGWGPVCSAFMKVLTSSGCIMAWLWMALFRKSNTGSCDRELLFKVSRRPLNCPVSVQLSCREAFVTFDVDSLASSPSFERRANCGGNGGAYNGTKVWLIYINIDTRLWMFVGGPNYQRKFLKEFRNQRWYLVFRRSFWTANSGNDRRLHQFMEHLISILFSRCWRRSILRSAIISKHKQAKQFKRF